ncbi:Phosphatidate phosphatase PPAPDC1A, partial [Orchesella cincta]
ANYQGFIIRFLHCLSLAPFNNRYRSSIIFLVHSMGSPELMKSFLLRIFMIYFFMLLEQQAPVSVKSQIPLEQYDRIRHGFPTEPFLFKTGGNGMVTMCSPFTLMVYPFFGFALVYKKSFCDEELCKAWLGPTLLFPLTGSIVNLIKIFASRPRPTFFARCYGENFLEHSDLQDECTGDPQLVLDGLKSFPSGHTALAFSSWTFSWLYVAGKTRLFAQDLRGAVKDGFWMGMFMIFYPMMVAASRSLIVITI